VTILITALITAHISSAALIAVIGANLLGAIAGHLLLSWFIWRAQRP
jgi:glycerol uptake facilitator-like aquaporin